MEEITVMVEERSGMLWWDGGGSGSGRSSHVLLRVLSEVVHARNIQAERGQHRPVALFREGTRGACPPVQLVVLPPICHGRSQRSPGA